MIEDTIREVVAFRDTRDWSQFHSPRNLASSIVIEAAELLEVFQWSDDSSLKTDVVDRRPQIEQELADVTIYCLLMAHDLGIDMEDAIRCKLTENARKYPVDKSKGNRAKYTSL